MTYVISVSTDVLGPALEIRTELLFEGTHGLVGSWRTSVSVGGRPHGPAQELPPVSAALAAELTVAAMTALTGDEDVIKAAEERKTG